jgi:hypothetical protein
MGEKKVRRGFSAFVSGLALLSSSGCPGGGDSTPSPGTPQPLPSMVQQAYIKPADPNRTAPLKSHPKYYLLL